MVALIGEGLKAGEVTTSNLENVSGFENFIFGDLTPCGSCKNRRCV
jgi:hypothetical protein